MTWILRFDTPISSKSTRRISGEPSCLPMLGRGRVGLARIRTVPVTGLILRLAFQIYQIRGQAVAIWEWK